MAGSILALPPRDGRGLSRPSTHAARGEPDRTGRRRRAVTETGASPAVTQDAAFATSPHDPGDPAGKGIA
ncbi:hypothetical protein GCM10010994_01140 [Chelatococcus reniformis]|uniref:Uncharacterized protein n=1 Tax=Chelatococcus reniformis TaxID=1494448 RepID=A0A916TW77_9HYPH|nr:hypothetical protein GCM10010994_01140 [Chelatococcus reniformis]